MAPRRERYNIKLTEMSSIASTIQPIVLYFSFFTKWKES